MRLLLSLLACLVVPISGFGQAFTFADQAFLSASGPWFSPAWNYRTTLIVNNTLNANSLTDYQVVASVTFTPGMQTNFNDLRVTDSDRITLLPFWIDTQTNSVYANIWIKVPGISASSYKSIYIYYGNSGAASASDSSACLFYDGLTSLAAYTSFGAGAWSIVSDADIGNCVNLNAGGIFTGEYKAFSLPSQYSVVLDTKKTWNGDDGNWAGPLLEMASDTTWWSSGYGIGGGNSNVVLGRFYSNSTPYNTTVNSEFVPTNIWIRNHDIVTTNYTYVTNSSFSSTTAYCSQGLATDGTNIFSAGDTNVAKYTTAGALVTSTNLTNQIALNNRHFGGLCVFGTNLYSCTFDNVGTSPFACHVFTWNLDLSGEVQVKDLTGLVGSGANSIVNIQGHWILGETGNPALVYQQHFYVFDAAWNLESTIVSPYNDNIGYQDAVAIDNFMWVVTHDGKLLVFRFYSGSLSIELSQVIDVSATHSQGITFLNGSFYLQKLYDRIDNVSFVATAGTSVSYLRQGYSGLFYKPIETLTHNYIGVQGYRSTRFSKLAARNYSFPEPSVSFGQTESR